MQHPSGKLSNDQYINGLQDANDDILISIYVEFRTAVVRTVTAQGGNEADGGIFFRAAVVETARQARARELPLDEPFFFHLREIALAHYLDWQAEPHEKSAAQETTELMPAPALSSTLPDTPTLRQTRMNIYAWRHFEQLDAGCQQEVLDYAQSSTPASLSDSSEPCVRKYFSLLQIPFPQHIHPTPLTSGEPDIDPSDAEPDAELLSPQARSNLKPQTSNFKLPDWVSIALLDTKGYQFWQKTQHLERKIANRQPLAPPPEAPPNKWLPRLAMALAAFTLLYTGYTYFFRSATPREVYQDNFQPPTSIMADLQTRQAADTMSTEPRPERPVACDEILRQADAIYQKKEYEAAAEVLYGLAESESLAPCHSDALFYLGIIALHNDDPGTALQCFAKIDNLDRFGEDIYWYQALAFVKMAELQPDLREKAARAVERAVGATQHPERRTQAEKMLEKLKK